MKISVFKSVTLFALLVITACTQDIKIETTQTINDSNAINQICITGKDFQIDDDTRSSVAIGDSGASFAWDEDDVIGIFPDKGDQVSFAMEQGAGTQTAIFSGGGWALKSSAKYAAYYPHVYENRDVTKISVSYVGQTQNGNANTDHIGAYDFMAASVTTPSNGAVAFDMQHLGALVQLTVTVPEPSTLTKVVLTSTTEFTQTGTIDLTDPTPVITPVAQSNTYEIALNNITTTEANENVTIYFMTAPVDLTDGKLNAMVYFDDETTYEVKVVGANLRAGKAYKLASEVKVLSDYIDEYGINHGKGTEIDGVVWAPVNCGYHETDFKYGKLYQWGRKYGQGYSGDEYIDGSYVQCADAIIPSISSCNPSLSEGQAKENANVYFKGYGTNWLNYSDDYLWNKETSDDPVKTEYDPCPDGWRVPTYDEMRSLMQYKSSWTTYNGQLGYWFNSSNDYSEEIDKVFLSAAGRFTYYGYASDRRLVGYYWTSQAASNGKAYYMLIYTDYVILDSNSRIYGCSVRCVQE